MGIYILSGLGLLIKVYIFFISQKVERKSYFYTMLAFFAIHNLSEFFLLFPIEYSIDAQYLIKSYYAATFSALTCMVIYAIKVSQISILERLTKPIFMIGLILTIVAISTDLIAQGMLEIGYTRTAERGAGYIIFPVFVLFTLIFIVTTLVTSIRKAISVDTMIHSYIVLLSLAPLLLCSFILLPVIILDLNMNATGIVPICTTAFLLIIVKTEAIHKTSDIRYLLPFSPERKFMKAVQKVAGLYARGEIGHKEYKYLIEQEGLRFKYTVSGENISEMSRIMQLKRSSVYSILSRHEELKKEITN